MTAPILRPYQEEGIAAARELVKSGKNRVLLTCPTGGGKTLIASSIIQGAKAKGKSVLFLAHRKELIQQTSAKLSLFGVEHGIIAAGMDSNTKRPVIVASVQTLVRRPNAIADVDLVFIDEAHHISAGSWKTIMGWYPGAKAIGLTATPWRLDGKGLGDFFEESVLVATPEQLEQQGFLVPLECYTFRAIATESVNVTGGDFDTTAMSGIAQGTEIIGDVVNQYLTHCRGKRGILFACDIAHSKKMTAAFVSVGVRAEHLDGNTPAVERAAILRRLSAGQCEVLCNVNVATEGFDCPAVEVIMLCRPTMSESLCLQMIGRGLRPCDGKTVARVHDHARMLPAHGHPYADRDWSMTRSGKKNRAAVEKAPKSKEGELFERPAPVLVLEAEREEYGKDGSRNGKKTEPSVWFRKLDSDGKKRFWLRMVEKHGDARKAGRIYRWASGDTEWAPHSWSAELLRQNQGD